MSMCGLKKAWEWKLVLAIAMLTIAGNALACEDRQEVYASPQGAVRALVAASRNGDKAGLLQILGPKAEPLINSGDPVADKENRERFVAAYDAAHALEIECTGKIVLTVGKGEWPMPIPLVSDGEGWWFDTAAGKEEILNRRIGRNELDVITTARAYVEAQREYAEQNPLVNRKPEYAQHFLSQGKLHDGLYWPVAKGEKESPLGPLMASAQAEGYRGAACHKEKCTREPFHGYYYRILKSQGSDSPGGAKNYVVHGHMTGGFALIAYPARYGDSGIMTFIVNQDGIVYEKNLGPDTAAIAQSISRYDPDENWDISRVIKE